MKPSVALAHLRDQNLCPVAVEWECEGGTNRWRVDFLGDPAPVDAWHFVGKHEAEIIASLRAEGWFWSFTDAGDVRGDRLQDYVSKKQALKSMQLPA